MADRVAAAARRQPAGRERRGDAAGQHRRVPGVPGRGADVRPGVLRRHARGRAPGGPADRGRACTPSPRLNRAWHERARRDHPAWPAVPYQAYYALAGATAELVRAEVRRGRTDAMTGLEDTLVALHLAVLAARPWAPPGT